MTWTVFWMRSSRASVSATSSSPRSRGLVDSPGSCESLRTGALPTTDTSSTIPVDEISRSRCGRSWLSCVSAAASNRCVGCWPISSEDQCLRRPDDLSCTRSNYGRAALGCGGLMTDGTAGGGMVMRSGMASKAITFESRMGISPGDMAMMSSLNSRPRS
jgi:hypothetical protein